MSALSDRGAELSAAGGRVETFKAILNDLYDPDTNPGGYVNIGIAENYIMLQEVADFVSASKLSLSWHDFSYGEGPWGNPRLLKAMANHITRHFHPTSPINPEHLLFANGVTSLCEMLGFSICDPGDAVLMSRPMYQAFKQDFGSKAKVNCEYVSFGDMDQFKVDAVANYETALQEVEKKGTRIRALMLCHPHNPLGRCYPRETLTAFMKLCQKHKIHLLVDEIYALSVFEIPDPKAVKFESVLSLDTDKYINPNYLHLLYGMSKDTAAGGLRLGCIYTQNKDLMQAMMSISNFHWSGSANEKVGALMLEDEKWMDGFLQLSRERLATNNKIVRKMLDDEGIEYYLGANAGFFLWIDLRKYLPGGDAWAAENELTKRLFQNKVFLTDGQGLSAEEAGWYRLIFSQDLKVVKEGIRRIVQVIKKSNGERAPQVIESEAQEKLENMRVS